MKPEQKVVSLELAQRLKDVGMPQGVSELVWDRHTAIQEAHLEKRTEARGNDKFAAPDCAELLEMLPLAIRSDTTPCQLFLHRPPSKEWIARYGLGQLPYQKADTPAEALGRLLLWCLENDHVKRD